MYKLLALDLDGTVLNSNHEISPYLINSIKRIAENTHVVIVTGRHHTAAQPYYEKLGLSTPIICCNGTYLYDYSTQSVLSENSISKDNAFKFLELADAHELKAVMYVRDAMLYSKKQPIAYMDALSHWALSFPEASRPKIIKVDNFFDELSTSEYIWKFVVEGGSVESFTEIDFINRNFNGERSWHDRVDFANVGNNKGTALAQYIDSLGISEQQVVSVGDNQNDMSMLKLAGMGIAMKNAEQLVQAAANMVTETSNDDEKGLSELLDELFL